MNDVLTNPALKEWAVIWDALTRGDQIVDLRKGGLHEEAHRFKIRATRFWLYDSYEHQRAELLKPTILPRVEATERQRPPVSQLRFSAWAELAAAGTILQTEQLAALADEFVWVPAYAAKRLNWRPKQPLWLLVLRVHRLLEPITVPLRGEYAGCSSWVPMRDLPADPATVASEPVLSEASFAERLARIRSALPAIRLEDQPAALIAAT